MDPRTRATGIPAGVTIVGDVSASEDLHILGRVDGPVTAHDHEVTIGPSAQLKSKVLARTVTITGTLDGAVTATEHVSILAGSHVRGHVHTPSILLVDGAIFNGTVDPNRTEAAMLVARYREKQRL
jgi:cytoskeletal protein CcmA (bactofilin family)